MSGRSNGIGGRLGVRRWHSRTLLSSYLLEYERTATEVRSGPDGEISAGGHIVSASARLELSPLTELVMLYRGIPEASGYVSASPLVHLNADDGPGFGYGWCAAIGVQANNVSGLLPLPAYIEVQYQQVYLDGERVSGFRLGVGLGI